MSNQIAQHRAEMQRLATPAITQFVADHPHYRIDPDQSGSQSVTNYVIFGHRRDEQGEQPVVFKYFCRDERKERELYGLRHFAATGLVPQLLDEHGTRLIVVARIGGGFLPNPATQTAAFHMVDQALVGFTLGQATAQLTSVPLTAGAAQAFESRFYEGESLAKYLNNILRASHAIQQRVACYRDSIFADSLAQIDANLDAMLGQPRLLYHQDAMNMHFDQSRFTGFFDLEMCRVGIEAMQIGALWRIFTDYDNWVAFAAGFANRTGRELSKANLEMSRAFANFMVWRSISDDGDWHGKDLGDAAMAQIEQDAMGYQATLVKNSQVGI